MMASYPSAAKNHRTKPAKGVPISHRLLHLTPAIIPSALVLLLTGAVASPPSPGASPAAAAQAITGKIYLPLVLKLDRLQLLCSSGNMRRYASWCETGWYSSPAVADIG